MEGEVYGENEELIAGSRVLVPSALKTSIYMMNIIYNYLFWVWVNLQKKVGI